MKKIILILLLLIAKHSFSQDSSLINIVGPNIRAMDWAYLYSSLDGPNFDPLRDSLEARWHRAVPSPLDSTPIQAIELRELIWIHNLLRTDFNANQFYQRVDGQMRRLNIPYLTRAFDAVDTDINNQIVARRQNNSNRMQGVRQ